jgi:IclR family transcriptional regulator, KDG regulon repressor
MICLKIRNDVSFFGTTTIYLIHISSPKTMQTNQNSSPTVTLARGLTIFEYIALQGGQKGVTLQEITKVLRIPRSNVYRYLTTFCEYGWLEKEDDSSRYFLGCKVLQIAGAFLQGLDLRNVARPYLEDLACGKDILSGDSILYIDKVESNSPIQMRSRLGMTAPCYCTAVGKAMLATLEPSQVAELLTNPLVPRTSNTITDKHRLIQHLDEVRRCGFALDNEENEEGIGCIGASIRNFENQLIGGLSISTLIQFLDQDSILELGQKVRNVAYLISQKMGYRQSVFDTGLSMAGRA